METHLEVNESRFINPKDQNDLLAHFFNPEVTSPIHLESHLQSL